MNIGEIARRARVSRATVSRVINNVETVDPKLAHRVQLVVEQVGYKPNYQARALASGRTHTVGLIVSELSGGNPFFADIILYFERAAVENGYEILISFADTERSPEHLMTCLTRMQERQVEGVAVLTFGMEQYLQKANAAPGFPMVFVGSEHKLAGIRNVRVDYATGMRAAVKHLVEFGHQRIGYLSGKLEWSSMRTRYEVLRKAIKSAGIKFEEDLVAKCDHTWAGGADGMAYLLSLPNPPTAVLCCNDAAAIGALKTLNARGLRAGTDVSLVGFDDLALCRFTEPQLTSIRFSPTKLSNLAFQALLEEIKGSSPGTDYEYRTEFILRESTGAPKIFTQRRAK